MSTKTGNLFLPIFWTIRSRGSGSQKEEKKKPASKKEKEHIKS